MTPNIIPEELTKAKDALATVGISGLPLFKTDKGEPVAINCTIDTRGLQRQSQADSVIADARRALEDVSNLPVTVTATGHAYMPPATTEETITFLQNNYDY